MNKSNSGRKQTNVFWFSTRRMNNFQFDSLKKKYGFINVKLCGKIIENFSEIENDINANDVIVSATYKYEKEIKAACDKAAKPFMRWKSNDPQDKNSDGIWEDVKIREERIFENFDAHQEKGLVKKIFNGIGYALSAFTTKKGLK